MLSFRGLAVSLQRVTTDISADVGSFALGVFMGTVTWFFMVRFTEYTPAALGSLVGVFAAGAIITFLDKVRGSRTSGLGLYAIGLVVGSAVFIFLAITDPTPGRWWPSSSPSPMPTPTPTATVSPSGT